MPKHVIPVISLKLLHLLNKSNWRSREYIILWIILYLLTGVSFSNIPHRFEVELFFFLSVEYQTFYFQNVILWIAWKK